MTAFCALVGLIAWRRRGSFYGPLAAALAAAAVAQPFALDRPYLFTLLLLAADRWPFWNSGRAPVAAAADILVWANCHGGYFLGWVVLGA